MSVSAQLKALQEKYEALIKEEIVNLKIIEDLKEQVAFLEQGKPSIVFSESKDPKPNLTKNCLVSFAHSRESMKKKCNYT